MISYGRSGSQQEVGLWFINQEDLTSSKFGFGAPPADWSPFGNQIVFEFLNENDEEMSNQIWKADTSGENKTQLTNNGATINRAPAWSPDGKWIAWYTNEGLWVMKPDASEQKLLKKNGTMPKWSPDSPTDRIQRTHSKTGKNCTVDN